MAVRYHMGVTEADLRPGPYLRFTVDQIQENQFLLDTKDDEIRTKDDEIRILKKEKHRLLVRDLRHRLRDRKNQDAIARLEAYCGAAEAVAFDIGGLPSILRDDDDDDESE